MKEQKGYSEFPQSFQDLIGKHNEYRLDGITKCKGIIVDMKWSLSTIVNLKNLEEEWYGIQLKFKPDDGSRAIWTKPFNSGIEIEKVK